MASPAPTSSFAATFIDTPFLMGSFVQILFVLVVVCLFVAGIIWFTRQLASSSIARGKQLRIIAGTVIGPKERIVIVEIQETWLLLGVTAHNISVVHKLPRPQSDPATATPRTFSQCLAKFLKKGKPPP